MINNPNCILGVRHIWHRKIYKNSRENQCHYNIFFFFVLVKNCQNAQNQFSFRKREYTGPFFNLKKKEHAIAFLTQFFLSICEMKIILSFSSM